jgi:hypothetical protein
VAAGVPESLVHTAVGWRNVDVAGRAEYGFAMSKKNPPSIPRSTTLLLDMGVPVTVANMKVSEDGRIELYGPGGEFLRPVSAVLERSYPRAKGAKVLSSIPLAGPEMVVDANLAMLDHGQIAVIDGNERVIQGKRVTAVATVRARRGQEPGLMEHFLGTAFEFHDVEPDRNADLIAIRLLCSEIEKLRPREDLSSVTFVIDSDLGKFAGFRARTTPIYEDWPLPEWAHLVFASDVAADSLVNVLLRTAHATSCELLDEIESKPLEPLPVHLAGPRTEYFRVWSKQYVRKSPQHA